jgi:hypothetical protein
LRQKYREIEKTALTRTEQGSYKLGLTLELKNMIKNKTDFNWKLLWNTRKELVLGVLFFILSLMILILAFFNKLVLYSGSGKS